MEPLELEEYHASKRDDIVEIIKAYTKYFFNVVGMSH